MSKIIEICSQNDYHYITNFEWYVSVLVELSRSVIIYLLFICLVHVAISHFPQKKYN